MAQLEKKQILCDIKQNCLDLLNAYGYKKARIEIDATLALDGKVSISIRSNKKAQERAVVIVDSL